MSGCTPPGTSFAFAGTGAAGLIGRLATGNAARLYTGLNGAFWSVRYPSASCKSLYIPKPARITVFWLNGLQATATRGCGRNLALLLVKSAFPMCGWVEIAPPLKV